MSHVGDGSRGSRSRPQERVHEGRLFCPVENDLDERLTVGSLVKDRQDNSLLDHGDLQGLHVAVSERDHAGDLRTSSGWLLRRRLHRDP